MAAVTDMVQLMAGGRQNRRKLPGQRRAAAPTGADGVNACHVDLFLLDCDVQILAEQFAVAQQLE